MKDSIKRAQSRAGSGFAERENFRPKVKQQKTKQLIMTLALLLTVATGAWADEPKVYDSGEVDVIDLEVGDILMPGVQVKNEDHQHVILDGNRFSVGEEIRTTEVKLLIFPFIIGENGLITNKAEGDTNTSDYTPITEDGKTGNAWVVTNVYIGGTHSIHFGGIEIVPPTSFPINWNATAKTASIAAMPAGNVTVKVNYYPQATADGAVTATTGAIVSTDAPLVTIDDDKLIGADGMMYYVSETITAPDYTTDGWTSDVPNAKNYTEAKRLYLWYYPLGHVGQTADDIYSDGNMNAEPLELSVAPVPTYNVYFAESADPKHWKAQPNQGVKQGQNVTVTYTGTRRVMGVNVEKCQQPTITIGDQVYRILPGETWVQLNDRLKLGWNIWNLDDDIYWVVYNDQQITVSSDGNNWQTLEFRIDSPIDTNKQYRWEDAGQ